jgi:hypothetical protein
MTTPTNATVTTHPVTIDYRKSLDEMVKAGEYAYANPDITGEHFPIQGGGEVPIELILVHIDRNIGSDDAVAELSKMGLEPARLEHATAFGEKYPDVQNDFPILFFGSVWTDVRGSRLFPYLCRWDDGRRLSLVCWDDEWDRVDRFAAVRKVPKAP